MHYTFSTATTMKVSVSSRNHTSASLAFGNGIIILPSSSTSCGRLWFFLLLVAVGLSQPTEWIDKVLDGDYLYTSTDENVPPSHMPAVANGYLGMQINSDSIYVSGVYNGKASGDGLSHRARIPNSMNIVHGGNMLHCALDLPSATYRRRSYIAPVPLSSSSSSSKDRSSGSVCSPLRTSEHSCTARSNRVWIEQKWYAHRVFRNLLVQEIEILGPESHVITGRPVDNHKKGETHEKEHITHAHNEASVHSLPHLTVPLRFDDTLVTKPNPRNKKRIDNSLKESATELRRFKDPNILMDQHRGSKDSTSSSKAQQHTQSAFAKKRSYHTLFRNLPSTAQLHPLQKYASVTEIAAAANASNPTGSGGGGSSSPLALLKLIERSGPLSPDIEFHDVTLTTCALGKADTATAVTRAALRGCNTEWTIRAGYVNEMELPNLEHTAVMILTTKFPTDGWLPVYSENIIYPFYTIIITSLEFPYNTSMSEMAIAVAAKYELTVSLANQGVLFAYHHIAWKYGLWESAGIDIETPAKDIQATLRASQYSLLSLIRADWPFGLSPGGISSNGYNGHSFWDGETFSWPPINVLHPDLASSVLLYRYYRLPGARQKAKEFYRPTVYQGAMFPWESAFSGIETCPTQFSMGKDEIHISGDVAISVWQHYQMTGDVSWLRDIGYPLLSGIADFWISRLIVDNPGAVIEGNNGYDYYYDILPAQTSPSFVQNSPTQWPLHIKGVIAATEFYHNVTDNFLTNAVAKLALLYATKAAQLLSYPSIDWYRWENAAGRIILPFDGSGSLRHPYFQGYDWNQPVQLLDIPLLHTVMGMDVPRDVAVADTKHYLKTFEGGAAFAYAINTIAAADIGAINTAHSFFAKAYATFVHGPFKVWTEYAGGSGCSNFITGAGGFIEAILAGYTGIRLHDNGISIELFLPDTTTRLRIRGIAYHGHRITIDFDGQLILLTAEKNLPASSSAWETQLLRSARYIAARDAKKVGDDINYHHSKSIFHWWYDELTSLQDRPANPHIFESKESDFLFGNHGGDQIMEDLIDTSASNGYAEDYGTIPPPNDNNNYNNATIITSYDYDPMNPSLTPEDMLKYRPWLTSLASLARPTVSSLHINNHNNPSSSTVNNPYTKYFVIVDNRGRETVLKPGATVSFGSQKLFITLKSDTVLSSTDSSPENSGSTGTMDSSTTDSMNTPMKFRGATSNNNNNN